MSQKSKLEKQIEIMKYCHTPRTSEEVELFCSKIGITGRTLRNYVRGIDFNDIHYPMYRRIVSNDEQEHLSVFSSIKPDDGVIVEPAGNREELNQYFSSMHPLFLMLNLSEVNLLTNKLMDLVEDSDLEASYKHLIGKIVYQLSDYAVERLGIDETEIPKVAPVFEDEDYYNKRIDLGEAYDEKMRIVRQIDSQKDSKKI